MSPAVLPPPLESGYGLHVVQVESREAARVLPFEDVRSAVESQWRDDEQERLEENLFERLKSRYEVVYLTDVVSP